MASKQEQWQAHLDAWRASGLSQSMYCKKHGLSLSSFGYWLHRPATGKPSTAVVPVVKAAISGNQGSSNHGNQGGNQAAIRAAIRATLRH
jgi:hypothetical protein